MKKVHPFTVHPNWIICFWSAPHSVICCVVDFCTYQTNMLPIKEFLIGLNIQFKNKSVYYSLFVSPKRSISKWQIIPSDWKKRSKNWLIEILKGMNWQRKHLSFSGCFIMNRLDGCRWNAPKKKWCCNNKLKIPMDSILMRHFRKTEY